MKLEIQRHEVETRERELRLIMIEWEQLLKEHGQIFQEMQVGLCMIDEAREWLKEMDRLQTALMKRLDHTCQQLCYLNSENNLLAFSEDKGDDDLI